MASEIIPIRRGEELEAEKINDFLQRNLPDVPDGPLEVNQFSAGHSNLTYQLKKGTWEAVLRRPPVGPVAPKAHDMEREFKFLKEIHHTFKAAPEPYLFNEGSIIGAPFFIMERKHGVVLDTDFPGGVSPGQEVCSTLSEVMADNLAALHDIDYKNTALAAITKPQGFMARQAAGWIGRYERAETSVIPEADRLKQWLIKHVPTGGDSAVIHYDYKLNNAMFNQELTELTGLFDWEMATVGDPLADLGAAMSYWIQPDDPELLKGGMGKPPVTVTSGFMTRQEFMERYAKKSGRDLSDMNYYLTFAYFKLAVICQQIFYRWKKGQTQDERFARLDVFVKSLIEHADYVSSSKY
ncbi:phosphotransferase family protein [Peribacillus sp. SCS-26]|uniref:phosphotransferase family protein n=1 Tax=Paraperibacillus marinus TaxID=3115295 RepID=UPI0039058669